MNYGRIHRGEMSGPHPPYEGSQHLSAEYLDLSLRTSASALRGLATGRTPRARRAGRGPVRIRPTRALNYR